MTPADTPESDTPSTPPRRGPVVFEIGEAEAAATATPDTAPPVPDDIAVGPSAVETLAKLSDARGGGLAAWVLRFGAAVGSMLLGIAIWSGVEALFARSTVLGAVFSVVLVGFGIVCLAVVIKELAALSRLSRIETIRTAAETARRAADVTAAKAAVGQLGALYAARRDVAWQADRLEAAMAESFDADGALDHAERAVLTPLDARALREVEAAARQVATVTALVPLALADLIVALTANLRMIRRIAEIYGGRAGTLGAWRLTRAVLTHLMATGALAVGDDLIGSVAGGGLLSKVSRRFGEGVVNGALTARVGIAAMEVCRPLPFVALTRPSVGGTVQRALAGLFQTSKSGAA